jgi:hypothetical protein
MNSNYVLPQIIKILFETKMKKQVSMKNERTGKKKEDKNK